MNYSCNILVRLICVVSLVTTGGPRPPAVTVASSTLNAADPQAEAGANYYPTRRGDKWVYLVSSATGQFKEFEIIEEVTDIQTKDGVITVSVGRMHDDGKMYPNREREVSNKGVLQIKNAVGEKYESPWVHLKMPHKAGQSWDVEVANESRRAEGPEKIKVPAGTYEAIRVETRQKGNKAAPSQTDWYARGLGIIKIVAGDKIIVMKSFTAGKD